MPRVFEASYITTYTFKIPTNIFLLDEGDIKNDGKQVGSWWIKCAAFYYVDQNGKTVEIEYDYSCEEKRPDEIEEIDPESDDEEDNSDCEKDGYENADDDFNLRNDDKEEEKMPVLFTCGSIVDCPAARAMEAADLAELEEERTATVKKDEATTTKKEEQEEDESTWEEVWNLAYEKGFKDAQKEYMPVNREDILARFHHAFQKLKNDATLMRDAPWSSMSTDERKNLCPSLVLLINKSEILY